jgi:AAA+ ATPase superfamily predicted ATPase
MPSTKPPEVFGRGAEWRTLDTLWERPRPDLVFVVGRRRVGKSFLLTRFSEQVGGIYYQATRRTEAEQLAVRYVLEFASPDSVSDATFAAIRKHRSERQLTDLTLIAAYYLAYGTMIKGFRVELESKDKLDIEMQWQKAHIERQ